MGISPGLQKVLIRRMETELRTTIEAPGQPWAGFCAHKEELVSKSADARASKSLAKYTIAPNDVSTTLAERTIEASQMSFDCGLGNRGPTRPNLRSRRPVKSCIADQRPALMTPGNTRKQERCLRHVPERPGLWGKKTRIETNHLVPQATPSIPTSQHYSKPWGLNKSERKLSRTTTPRHL